ncbi:RnfH family protein [Nitrosomonas sp.]|uniref:RnfH family protein n=1 Tax=Nitrosomonas sp. TaxID=42353 RepID=UPI001D8FD59B|nr:RnfH family protein [Nitrosomonas sp.]MBX3616918.1 RnfH family protein [Nitrosomonas sp.]
MANAESAFQVEIVYALPKTQVLKQLTVPDGCTVEQALLSSELLNDYPEIDLAKNRLGIFGKFVQLDDCLRPHDRIEIYRPLVIDPKEARRKRVGSRNKR